MKRDVRQLHLPPDLTRLGWLPAENPTAIHSVIWSTGQTISALVSADDRADLAQGACFNDTGVEVGLA